MEKNGNATELYVQRKVSDIVQERDRLKADLDEAQKLNKEMADNKEANKETLRMLNKIDNDLALRNSAAKQPTTAGQIGIPAIILYVPFQCFPSQGKVGWQQP